MHTDRISFLGVRFDRLTMHDVLDKLAQVTSQDSYAFVVTPNVDHVVRLGEPSGRSKLAPAYDDADMCLCDSRVLKQLARLHGLDLPLVPGSDLTVRMFETVIRAHDKIAIVGGSESLVERLRKLVPHVEFVQHNPPMGLQHDANARQEAAAFVARAKARFTFLAVGSPQQEMIAAAVRSYPDACGTALCVGASLDFITGLQRRAPRVLQRLHLEWAYRLISNPRRMWRRYLVEGPRVFLLAARYHRSDPVK